MFFSNRKIILFIPNGIGDILMALPLIRRLLSQIPPKSLAIVVSNAIQKKLLEKSIESNVVIYSRFNRNKFSQFFLLLKLIAFNANICFAPLISKKLVNKIFLFLTFTKTIVPKGMGAKYWPNLIESGIRIDSFGGHQVNYYLSFVGSYFNHLDINPVNFPEMKLLSYSVPQRSKSDKPIIAFGISCGVLERHKIPDPRIFAKIANQVASDIPAKILIFGTAEDLPLLVKFEASLNPSIELTKLVDMPLDQLITALSCCDVGVCGTTGQGHMMAAASLPVLILSGVTSELESGPYTEIVGVVKHDLPCGPCYGENYRFGCGKIACMDLIDAGLASNYLKFYLKNQVD